MKLNNIILTFVCVTLCGIFSSNALAQLSIVTNGKSTFTIVTPSNAPTSLQNAAQELQTDIELATGAKLQLQKNDAEVAAPFISLGCTH